MTSVPAYINTIIFDLGGVIVNLSVQQTLLAFAMVSGKTTDEVITLYASSPALLAYEKGKISDAEFRNAIRDIFSINVSDKVIDRCWNAMLLDLPTEKLVMLTKLKKHFRVLALSNTNSIHLKCINDTMLPEGIQLDSFFHHAYYSHTIGMRKPDAEIYKFVLRDSKLVPGETLFLDDLSDNVNAAAMAGIQTFQVTHPDQVLALLNRYE